MFGISSGLVLTSQYHRFLTIATSTENREEMSVPVPLGTKFYYQNLQVSMETVTRTDYHGTGTDIF